MTPGPDPRLIHVAPLGWGYGGREKLLETVLADQRARHVVVNMSRHNDLFAHGFAGGRNVAWIDYKAIGGLRIPRWLRRRAFQQRVKPSTADRLVVWNDLNSADLLARQYPDLLYYDHSLCWAATADGVEKSRQLWRRMPGLIAVSNASAAVMRGFWGVTAPITVCRNGLPGSFRVPHDDELEPVGRGDVLRLGMVGRLWEEKGHAIALHALQALGPDVESVTLTIVGDGPLLKPLQALAGRLGISGRVRFAGHYRDPAQAYREMDVLLAPSIFDSWPLMTIEAFAFGVPVIASETGGLPEIVDDGVNGLLITPELDVHDYERLLGEPTSNCRRALYVDRAGVVTLGARAISPAALAKAVAALLAQRERLAHMGQAARRTCGQQYRPEAYVARLLASTGLPGAQPQ